MEGKLTQRNATTSTWGKYYHPHIQIKKNATCHSSLAWFTCPIDDPKLMHK